MLMEKARCFLITNPVTIDNEGFNQWLGNCLNMTLGPCSLTSAAPAAGIPGNQQAMDYLALSKILATTIGSNIMQFSQVTTLTGGEPGARAVKQPWPPEKSWTKIRLQSSRTLVASEMPSKSLPSGQ